MSNHKTLDVDYVKFLYAYCPTGKLIPLINMGQSESILPVGYAYAYVGDRLIPVHRIIYALHYGDPGYKDIDPIDRNKLNNKIENLRAVTRAENMQNQSAPQKNNKSSGVRGVTLRKRDNTWIAEIKTGALRIRNGGFKNKEDAIAERERLVKLFHPNAPTA